MRLLTSVFSLVLLLPTILANPITGGSDPEALAERQLPSPPNPVPDKALAERQLDTVNQTLVHLGDSSTNPTSRTIPRNIAEHVPDGLPVSGGIGVHHKRADASSLATPSANATLAIKPSNFHEPKVTSR